MLKKLITTCLLILAVVFSTSALDLGLGVDFNIQSRTERDDDAQAVETTLDLSPVLIMRLSETLEIDPFLLIRYTSESNPDGVIGVGIDQDETQLSMGGGATLLFHFLQVKKMDFSIGAKASILFSFQPQGDSAPAYSEYGEVEMKILAPIVLDINFYKNFYFRIKHEIPVFSLEYLKENEGGGTTSTTTIQFLDYEDKGFGLFTIYLGLFYMF